MTLQTILDRLYAIDREARKLMAESGFHYSIMVPATGTNRWNFWRQESVPLSITVSPLLSTYRPKVQMTDSLEQKRK